MEGPQLICTEDIGLRFSPIIINKAIPTSAIAHHIFTTHVRNHLDRRYTIVVTPISSPATIRTHLIITTIQSGLCSGSRLEDIRIIDRCRWFRIQKSLQETKLPAMRPVAKTDNI